MYNSICRFAGKQVVAGALLAVCLTAPSFVTAEEIYVQRDTGDHHVLATVVACSVPAGSYTSEYAVTLNLANSGGYWLIDDQSLVIAAHASAVSTPPCLPKELPLAPNS